MASSRNVIIAGAGIGGLSAALMLAQIGLPRHTAGTGRAPGGDRRRHPAFAQRHPHPDRAGPRRAAARATRSRRRRSRSRPRPASTLAAHPARRRRPNAATARPTGAIHRADLQAALLEAVHANPDIVAAARHAGRGLRRACARRQRRLPARPPSPPTSTASR